MIIPLSSISSISGDGGNREHWVFNFRVQGDSHCVGVGCFGLIFYGGRGNQPSAFFFPWRIHEHGGYQIFFAFDMTYDWDGAVGVWSSCL